MPDYEWNSMAWHPAVMSWFRRSFGEPTDVQARAWTSIKAGSHTLIAAPTGSGKTLASLLPCVNAIVQEKTLGDTPVPKGVKLLYITPLKALNNDIQHHVLAFAGQIEDEAKTLGIRWPGFRSGVRTGDTSSSQRASMLRNPPELLITTPESLYILLTSEQGRGMLSEVRYVIVDEIHDLAGDKRGAHLSVSLERLEHNAANGVRIQRIGVSATQKPLWKVAQFLGGLKKESLLVDNGHSHASDKERYPLGYALRPVEIVESHMEKRMDVRVTMPDTSVSAGTRDGVWLPILQRIFKLMENCTSALLFVNSRRLCERLVLRINDHVGYQMARSHHGSMSKEKRLEAEAMLKSGELRCLVATSSLELGIDVGHIDLVLQIDSPLEAASGIQRIGRAGHGVGDLSRGVIIIRQRGVLPEAAVLGGLIANREIEPIQMPEKPLDVLSQQIIAIVASSEMTVNDLYQLLLGSYSYRELDMDQLKSTLAVLAGLYPFARPILDWNRDSGLLSKRGNTSIAAMTGAGTIPQSSHFPVHHLDSRTHLGELDEEFVHESRVGDVFLLGTSSWMIRKIDKDRVYVSEAANSFSEVPFWRNEGPGRTLALGMKVGELIESLSARLSLDPSPDRSRHRQWSNWRSSYSGGEDRVDAVTEWLGSEYGLDDYTAGELMGYIVSQHAFSELPTASRIVIEHYKDMMNQTHVIILNPYGRRLNRTWLLAIQRQFERTLPYTLYGNAKDNGIEFVLPEWDASWLRMIWEVTPANVEPLLTEAVTGSPLLAIAFRRIAETSLLLARSFTRVPMWQKRLRSEELLRESLPYAESFPFLTEAMKECLYDYLDLVSLRSLLTTIQEGEIEVVVRETEYPSPMATQFLADYVNMRLYEGDGLDAATKAGLLHISKDLAGELFGRDAVKRSISDDVLHQVEERIEKRSGSIRSADELRSFLKIRGDMSLSELIAHAGAEAVTWLRTLASSGNVEEIDMRSEHDSDPLPRWICADEAEIYAGFPDEASSCLFIVSRYAEGRMSYTEPELCERYPVLQLEDARRITEELLSQELIRQAPFAADDEERIWTSSKAAEQMVRLSIGEARQLVPSIAPSKWCGYLAYRQHALQGAQLQGQEGLLAVIGRMQGLFLPAVHWESFLFPSRLKDYRKEELDALCATGEVVWLGSRGAGQKEGRIAFFLASNAALLSPYAEELLTRETAYPELLRLLRDGGASFLTQISRQYGKPPSETLSDLLELAWEGHASNDQFAPLRLGIGKKGKDWARTGSGFGRWYWTGALAGKSKASSGENMDDELDKQAESTGSQLQGKTGSASASHWIHQLIECYGIITKELITAYTPFRWDEVLPVLVKLEEWGTLTRGVFVEGAAAMQFTTPEIAEALSSPIPGKVEGKVTVLSALDPANPYGLFIDWPAKSPSAPSYARKAGSYVVLSGGDWQFWLEAGGKKVYEVGTKNGRNDKLRLEALRTMFGVVLRRQGLTKIVIEEWNGEPISQSGAAKQLVDIGAERDRNAYVLWMSKL
ncbi:DEAD/DEAH box helicase [Paenibacillus paeoniae]|uniref:DEAD/DEAH box helicase n=1 Tax=Paenibacillus paeoniae TaxID=2292705 RepID=A0A371PLH5_9BACL|nr:DEAD/DEAH box helicase [Paenibacillus paeoniae]REK77056.1 DEAD/DEAH box helicase [Paenibacillus paeoniae]